MSIYNNIYTLNKIQWNVDTKNTVILKCYFVYSLQSLQQFPLSDIYSEKFNFLILFQKLAKLARSFS